VAESLTSVVLPVHNQADHIRGVVRGYLDVLQRLPNSAEVVLVTNACSDESVEVCEQLAAEEESVTTLDLAEGGWGRAVKAGVEASRGDVLCYTNSARTTPEMLALALAYSAAYPDVVVKANRKIRDSLLRRLGSLLYNLECRALFDLPTWDINGTPKVFPREFRELLELREDGDLIDAEFNWVCRREGYPVIEVPVLATVRHGGASTTNYGSAVRMYWGAWRLYRSVLQR
jgi:glycosyltransferase involved in cell wall biosynthesis